MIGLDTTAIIDLFKGDESVREVVENIKEPLASTIINHQEIMFGIDSTDRKYKNESEYYEKFFADIPIIQLDIESSKKSAEVFWKLRKEGKEIGRSDCIVAGIFLSNGINKLITKNVSHFKAIKELKVIAY